MNYKFELNKDVKKFLLKHEDISISFFKKLEILLQSPFSNNLDIKPLKWYKDHYRLRIWKYRFLYEIIDQKILIYFYDADSRWDIY